MTTSSLYLSTQLLVGEMLRRASHKFPNQEAVVYENQRLTFKQLEERATHMAGWLQSNGIKKNGKVGFILRNGIPFVETYFGVALSGGVGVPINFRLAPNEIEYIVNNSDTKILIIDKEYVEVIRSLKAKMPKVKKVISIDSSAQDMMPYEQIFMDKAQYTPCESLSDNDSAMIVYTSGTTGRPKGAVLSHKNLYQNVMNMSWEVSTERHGRTLFVTPMFHIGGLCGLISICMFNGTAVIHREFEPESILKTIEQEKITGIGMVPAMWLFLFQVPNLENYDLSSVRRCTTGAAICPLELKKKIIKYFKNASIIDTFGQSETASSTTCLFGEDFLRKTTSVGMPTINVEVRVVDDEMNDVPVGAIGEIVYRGPTVMKEYYNNPSETEKSFKGGWFHSGDLVRMDEEGYIYVIDRRKDMIISGGENIYPSEIEEILYTHPAILECAVIGLPDETWGEKVKAFVVPKKGESLTEEDIISFCGKKIASYKKPKEVEFLSELPRNTAGKVLKQALRSNPHQKKGNNA